MEKVIAQFESLSNKTTAPVENLHHYPLEQLPEYVYIDALRAQRDLIIENFELLEDLLTDRAFSTFLKRRMLDDIIEYVGRLTEYYTPLIQNGHYLYDKGNGWIRSIRRGHEEWEFTTYPPSSANKDNTYHLFYRESGKKKPKQIHVVHHEDLRDGGINHLVATWAALPHRGSIVQLGGDIASAGGFHLNTDGIRIPQRQLSNERRRVSWNPFLSRFSYEP